MKNLMIIKEIYSEGFKDLENVYIALFMKIYAWSAFSLIAMAVCAFISNAVNGFTFG